MHKTGQLGGVLGRCLGPLLKTWLPLVGNVLKPLARSVLIQLELTAAVLETDVAIHKKMFGYGRPSDLATSTITFIIYDYIYNEEINDTMKIVKSFEESIVLIKGLIETIKMKEKNKMEDFSECY